MSRIGAKAKREKEKQEAHIAMVERGIKAAKELAPGSIQDEIACLKEYIEGFPPELAKGPYAATYKARLAQLEEEAKEGVEFDEVEVPSKVTGPDIQSLMLSAFALGVIWFVVSILFWKCT